MFICQELTILKNAAKGGGPNSSYFRILAYN